MSDRSLFGRLAIERGYVTAEQLEECLRIQREGDDSKRLGEIFVDEGWLTVEQVMEIIRLQLEARSGR